MNDEIKEILTNCEKAINEASGYNDTTDKILDYITNLQQKEELLRQEISDVRKAFNDLQQENERLKETNVYCNRTDCVGRIKDSRKYDSVYQEKEDYKSRCPRMDELGYKYTYHKGLIDKTPYYTRVEEDYITYTHPKRTIQFNLDSKGIVITEAEDNAYCYGGRPTLFFQPNLIEAMNDVVEKLGWKE